MISEPFRPAAVCEPAAQTVAAWIGGELLEAALAPPRLTGLATLAEAGATDITFVASEKFLAEARQSRAGLIVTTRAWDLPGRARVVVGEVWAAVARIMQELYPAPSAPPGVHPTAIVGEGVRLGEGVSVGPYCVVGDGAALGDGVVLGPHCLVGAGCAIGRGTRLAARVTLVGRVLIGERVVIHPGAVLGADGFKFERVGGRPLKIPQVGAVVIEDDVEIGANATIDRAFLYETRIGRGTKIDNLVQIAHNVQVGPGCMMAAQVGIAGSTRIGAGCLFGGQAGIPDGVTIGDGVMLAGQAGVYTDIPVGGMYVGAPATPVKEFWRMTAVQKKLPDLARRLRALEQKVEQMEKIEGAGEEGKG